MRLLARAALLALAPLVSLGCSTYRDDLARGQHAFEQNQHERALAIFRALEADTSHLTPTQRAQYAYLRGMTDYRIGYRADARHWLVVAKALEEQTPGVLSTEWKGRLDEALAELNPLVYAGGMDALAPVKARIRAPEPKAKPKADEEEEEQPPPKKKKPADDDE